MTSSQSAPDSRRHLPSVDVLLRAVPHLIEQYGRSVVLATARDALVDARQSAQAGRSVEDWSLILAQRLEATFAPSLRPVINATGVIIHTNLGRAPLSLAAQAAMQAVAGQYSTLEYDLPAGRRGSRYVHAEAALCDLTGAEAALVVNNNAAALVLALAALGQGRGAVIARGQLVEIGGGFRIPDIIVQSGVRLVEVGATNRTRLDDYEQAIDETTALILRVHASNFRQIGFVANPALAELAELARCRGILLVDDLGSGTLLDTTPYGLEHEPTVQESLMAGVDLVVFSGDKLLGGPQAGILAGRADVINRLRNHPLARAMRADKLCYAALSATLDHYRRDQALTTIPVWQMISRPRASIADEAAHWAQVTGGRVVPGESTVGGGSLPGTTLPTWLLALDVPDPSAFVARLRRAAIPVIARIQADEVVFDPRTVLPGQAETLLSMIGWAQADTPATIQPVIHTDTERE